MPDPSPPPRPVPDEPGGLRLFIAVDPPADTRQRAAEIVARLRRCAAPVTWIDPERLHLTLHFLGDGVPREALPDLCAALDAAAAACPPIDVAFTGVGAFPDIARPRVLWLDVQQGAEPLGRLHAALAERLRGLGHRVEDRPFRPHLTLGRLRPPWQRGRGSGRGAAGRSGETDDRLTRALAALATVPAGAGRIDSVALHASRLDPGGAVHERLHEAPLGGPAAHGGC